VTAARPRLLVWIVASDRFNSFNALRTPKIKVDRKVDSDPRQVRFSGSTETNKPKEIVCRQQK
jgi:hypothetical protein